MGAARLEEDEWEARDGEEFDRPIPDGDLDDEQRARREARQARREAGERNRQRLRHEAEAAIGRAKPKGGAKPKKSTGPRPARDRSPLVPRRLPDPKKQLKTLLGESAGGRAWRDLRQAAEHVDEGRAGSARPLAERLYKQVPEVVEVAEIWGLTLYGLGRWDDAIEVLEDVRDATGLPDTNPVLADAHRARGNWADVEVLWNELREASPASAIVTEGRIVTAGARADQGDLGGAVRLLSKGWKRPKRPLDHHLRRAYALADLYERAGERAKAKELFGWVAHHAPDYGDAADRSR